MTFIILFYKEKNNKHQNSLLLTMNCKHKKKKHEFKVSFFISFEDVEFKFDFSQIKIDVFVST